MGKYDEKVKIDKKMDLNEALRKIVNTPLKKDSKKPKDKGKKK